MKSELEIIRKLKQLDTKAQRLFGCLVVEKMEPNFIYSFTKSNLLVQKIQVILEKCYHFSLQEEKPDPTFFAKEKKDVENFMPDLDQASGATSYAFDFCVALDSLIDFFETNEFSSLEGVLAQAVATVDMFVQEFNELDPADVALEQKIRQNEFMVNEINRQTKLLQEIQKMHLNLTNRVLELRKVNNDLPEMVQLQRIYPLG